MPVLTRHHIVDDDGLAALRSVRRGALVAERVAPTAPADHTGDATPAPVAPTLFEADHGPFDRYRRSLDVSPAASGWAVTERVDFRLATPLWRPLMNLGARRELLRDRPGDHVPWWAPPDRFDAVAARSVSLLCIAALVTGYLGTLIGQTATFASDEFAMSDRAQGFLLAGVRIGTVITLVVAILADRTGRRLWLLTSIVIGSAATVVGAVSTGPWTLGISQSIARGFATAIGVLMGIMAAEVAPRNSRAYVASVLTLCAGLGAGMAVWLLPLADLGLRAWRLLYVLPIVGLPLGWWMARTLTETDRFAARMASDDTAETDADAMLRSRLVLVAAVAFLTLLFAAPASQFRNEFLRDERGFSGAEVSLFVLMTNTPVGIGVAIAGKLADRRGRRPVAAFGVAGGALLTVATYAWAGWGMWAASVFASIIGAMAAPTLGVYQAELFGTGRRGRANGIITLIALAGSALGLLAVGDLSERLGSFAAAFGIVVIAPLVVVALVLTLYPETAHRELEDINPSDRRNPLRE